MPRNDFGLGAFNGWWNNLLFGARYFRFGRLNREQAGGLVLCENCSLLLPDRFLVLGDSTPGATAEYSVDRADIKAEFVQPGLNFLAGFDVEMGSAKRRIRFLRRRPIS